MPLPYRIDWQDSARADVRQIDRVTAMRIFEAVLHHSHSGGGDVAPLHGDLADMFRLRSGDYRVFFRLDNDVMQIYALAPSFSGLSLSQANTAQHRHQRRHKNTPSRPAPRRDANQLSTTRHGR